MVNLFRGVISVSLALLLVGLMLPFDQPVHVTVELDQPPPAWFFACGVFALTALAAVVAAVALLRFRRWGRWLAVAVVIGGAAAVWLAHGTAAAEALSALSATLLALSAVAWLCGLAMTHHPVVAARFRHEAS